MRTVSELSEIIRKEGWRAGEREAACSKQFTPYWLTNTPECHMTTCMEASERLATMKVRETHRVEIG